MMHTGIRWIVAAALLAAGATTALAGPEKHEEHEPYVGSTEFERIKGLVGRWEGSGMGEKPITIEYELTAGESAVVERFSPGTPHEMLTIYHDRGDQLSLTHYCMLGNQPEMALSDAKPRSLAFEFTEGNGLNRATDAHMHALKITFSDENEIVHDWSYYEKGEEKEVHSFTFSRVP